jgi:UDP-N-acetylmuramoylalanine--D-glutamate ligase
MMVWLGKRVVILGVARQGTALARYLVACGAQVTLSDMKPQRALSVEMAALKDLPIRYVLGGHPMSLLDECDVLCLSGGVPIDLPIVLEARRRGVPLSNDSQIFCSVCPAPVIGITGSAGKTTTTTLVGEMLRLSFEKSGQARVWVGGNIGNPLINDVADIRVTDRVVLELSSFQLELMTLSPHIACVTNITPNHLDRHGTMENYIAAKQHILAYQQPGDWAVLGMDNDVAAHMPTAARKVWFGICSEPAADGAWMDAAGHLRIRLAARGLDAAICDARDLLLMGDHNVQNVLAACAISALAGATVEAMRAVATSFRGVAHRLQMVRELNGVRYYDASISTAPERLMADLHCFRQPVVLLCGGRDKHLPWGEAVRLMAQRCRHVGLFGEMAGLVHDEMVRQKADVSVSICDSLDQAVKIAVAKARPGDVVVLSPGGTSFDAFKDFEERGDYFVQMVSAIGDTTGV